MNQRAYRDGERPEVLLHPDDAVACGVADGDEVEVRSATGVLRMPVRVTDATRPGAASIPHGWADTNVNLLISCTDIDSLTGMPLMSGTPVEITKVPVPVPAAVPV
jgi:anaerobic selenocysteine-containing dehydrogenase